MTSERRSDAQTFRDQKYADTEYSAKFFCEDR